MTSAPYWVSSDAQTTLYCGDATSMLVDVTYSQVGTVITDPPWYGMEFAHQIALGLRPWNEGEEAIWLAKVQSFYWQWLPHLRTLVEYNNGRAFISASQHHVPALARMAFLAGWPVRRLWYAPESEGLLQFGRPIPSAAAAAIEAAWDASGHFNQTDGAVLEAILAASEGTVFDPFCGTGTTLVAARAAGRAAIGIEARPETCALVVERMQAGGVG